METTHISNLPFPICRIGLGTWAIGGWLWGGTNEKEAIEAIHRAFDLGINLIDTAPVYGFGISEEIVGKALKSYRKKKDILISTKVGLDWREGAVFRDSRKTRIMQEIEESLKRLGVDKIDLYQIHWPDFETPFAETAEAMRLLWEQGKIGAIGVSNYTAQMMDTFRQVAPIHALQSPYNLFEREIETLELPYCKKNRITVLGYGSLCRGLLSGKMNKNRPFKGDDLRRLDPKFHEPHFSHYLRCVEALDTWVATTYKRSILELALRWALDQGIDIALWGVRRPQQLDLLQHVWEWKLTPSDLQQIDQIITKHIAEPIGPEFMQPQAKSEILQKNY